ncbi:type IV pilus twitching motility protein PilT [Pseudomonas donghuensis]|uniref:type IV pilus twitching motility protein PilT n=1 Tax=Pseudomonas donghuensis TaxID=1163398 RepID=UPI000C2A072D|nr:type IV pilus twitching motility protein PilT [Pseudomonas donghuensis]MCP6696785.1 type IV pilus twitching motility protein PilT [Pseudomonas donghuensis]PJY95723.1 twitching motility protein PilT [Pseudomonas donghuensis]WKY28659.1 type IV pilus twitching motility protein PilT [Pseudomonas donghuensis]
MDVTELLALAVRAGASDLHLAAGEVPALRLEGRLSPLSLPLLTPQHMGELLAQIMSEAQQKDFETHLDVDFAFAVPALARFRVNVFQQLQGAAAVLRVIPAQVSSLAELGLGDVFRQIAELAGGLVLVTGPTGSGKSTTLAALVDHLNRERPLHIVTLEDPIEFIHSSQRSRISQREIGRHSHGFAQALRAALRQDPDVIMLGELRDPQTIRLALTAAETGHLVLATVHTGSAAKTIDRLVDVFAAEEKQLVRAMLAESLQAVVSQVLVERVGGGRVAAHEILLATPAVRNLVREGKVAQLYSAIQTGGAQGMQTLDGCLQGLVRQGLVSPDSARERAPGRF